MKMALCLYLLCVQATSAPRSAVRAPTDAVYDCGTMALYSLLKLEGKSANLKAVELALPPISPGGYSFQELQAGAATLGLRVQGVRVGKGLRALDRPAIAFMDGAQHGHFITIRPVGHTGTLVEVIDTDRTVEVLDRAELCARRGWTGLALVPVRMNNWWLKLGAGLLAAAIVGILLNVVLRAPQLVLKTAQEGILQRRWAQCVTRLGSSTAFPSRVFSRKQRH
jgi:hypothetical protein